MRSGRDRVTKFEAGEVPEAFGHREHLAICWDFLEVYGVLDTLDRLPAALKRIVAAAGVPEKFNATQTACWVLLVAERKAGAASFEELLERCPELLTNLPRQRYGEALQLPAWKARFLPPPVATEFEVVEGAVTPAVLAAMSSLFAGSFEGSFADVRTIWTRGHNVCTVLAWREGELVGFKLGSERVPHQFHSALGVVAESARGTGVARGLMRRQHRWAREQGYRAVTTTTLSRYARMVRLNVAAGFVIVGTMARGSDTKVLFQLAL